MQVWPAIDLRGGRCVRLAQGDYARETIYADNPVDVALQFVDLGAEHLHLVDLDGAREGKSVNRESVANIVRAVDIPCELGGGIRQEATIRDLLDCGLARLVLGTSALKHSDWFLEMCNKYPKQLVLGIDARDGRVATDGWLETSDRAAAEVAEEFSQAPLAAIVYTDIATDGMLSGPNLDATREMVAASAHDVVASGGVRHAEDVAALAATGARGCIIGKALYEGTLKLPDALFAAQAH